MLTMQLPKWLRAILESKPVNKALSDQKYRDDRRFMYILILLAQDGGRFSRTYGTSSPLNTGHRIVLAPGKIFTVTTVIHVTYAKNDVDELTRSTTFVHAGIVMEHGQYLSNTDLTELWFTITDNVFPYTIH